MFIELHIYTFLMSYNLWFTSNLDYMEFCKRVKCYAMFCSTVIFNICTLLVSQFCYYRSFSLIILLPCICYHNTWDWCRIESSSVWWNMFFYICMYIHMIRCVILACNRRAAAAITVTSIATVFMDIIKH